jgi:transmembrane 9 superfamily protein 2/4
MVRMREDTHGMVKTYERGYPIGFKGVDTAGEVKFLLNNHLRFTILYHEDAGSPDLARIVGFEVEPFSIKHRRSSKAGPWDPADPALRTCEPEKGLDALGPGEVPQEVAAGEEVYFTHDFVYRASDIRWASRWDTYLHMTDTQIHWFSIVNSLVIVLFLSAMVALIMMRTLHADIAKYNSSTASGTLAPAGQTPGRGSTSAAALSAADALADAADAAEESGWKLVHGDVLRQPSNFGTLAVYVGSGVQVLGMISITMVFALLGFLSPANRGALMTAMLLLFSFCGVAAGYTSARLYTSVFRGTSGRGQTLRTALTFPGVAFLVFIVLNTLIWGQHSSGAVPFGTLFVLCFLWFGISVPLVFVGAYFGARGEPLADPVRTNKIPRQIPEQPLYMSAPVTILLGGVLPFGAVFIELYFILSSMWLHQFYYLFGFLFLVQVILGITCAEIAIVLVYFQLCAEDYTWWWRAFLTPASSALYLFGYATYYFFTKLDITKGVSSALYFGYMFLFSYSFFTGARGATHPAGRVLDGLPPCTCTDPSRRARSCPQ